MRGLRDRRRFGIDPPVAVGALLLVGLLMAVAISCTPRAPEVPAPEPQIALPRPTPARRSFVATAYSDEGSTASGRETRHGIVAADPRVLPMGSHIRVTDAGAYSGMYTVADTGRKIKGEKIDIYIANDREARRFGRRTVQVEVVAEGGGK